jgi:hypothetical protein
MLINLSLPLTGETKFFQSAGAWKELYSEDFSAEDKRKIVSSLNQAVRMSGITVDKHRERLSRIVEVE